MRIIICDDKKEERELLSEMLIKLREQEHLQMELMEYGNAEELVQGYSQTKDIDIIFLDIYMDEMTGFDAAKVLRDRGYEGDVIFCTQTEEYGVKSYEVEARGYLVKPFTYDNLCRTISRCRERIRDSYKKIGLTDREQEIEISLREIVYIEVIKNYCYFHLLQGERKVRTTFKTVEKLLQNEKDFYRVGRSYIVNLGYMSYFDKEYIYQDEGSKILIPKSVSKEVQKHISEYYWKRTREER